jgi:hypothetical protein
MASLPGGQIEDESGQNQASPLSIKPRGVAEMLAAAVVDRRLPFAYFRESADKQHLLLKLKQRVDALRALPGVRAATLYKALLIPPGRGHFLKQRPAAHIARYDVAALVEAESPAAAKAVNATSEWNALQSDMHAASKDVYAITASNVKRIGPVDRTRDGVFLFNYFFADRLEQNLAVWEYTAGWFEYETDLHNSTVLLPEPGERRDYTIINHCRWDSLWNILPALLLKPSFRSYVLAHFEANNTAAIPILYRLA